MYLLHTHTHLYHKRLSAPKQVTEYLAANTGAIVAPRMSFFQHPSGSHQTSSNVLYQRFNLVQ